MTKENENCSLARERKGFYLLQRTPNNIETAGGVLEAKSPQALGAENVVYSLT